MKKASGIILIILGSAISVFGFLVVVRMLLHFSPVILSLRLGDPSELLAFLFFVFCAGGGIALIFIGRKLHRG
jgi:choline-glycine betaine transporter